MKEEKFFKSFEEEWDFVRSELKKIDKNSEKYEKLVKRFLALNEIKENFENLINDKMVK